MAYSKQVLVMAVIAAVACLASLGSATVYMVGDGLGWRVKFNETGWANGKTFRVGDSLLFLYPKGNHTVAQVGKEDFAACNLQGNPLRMWDSGNDVVPLDKPGKAWFICTKPGHCDVGMKFAVDVADLPAAPSPLPGTGSAPSPLVRWPFHWGSAPGPAPVPPVAAPPSAAARNPVGCAVAASAAAVVAAALAF